MARDFQNVQLFINGCQDRFKTLPGDDHSADVHVGGTILLMVRAMALSRAHGIRRKAPTNLRRERP